MPERHRAGSSSPRAAAAAITSINDPTQRTGERWSASMYVWHLVDVLRKIIRRNAHEVHHHLMDINRADAQG